MAKSKSPSFDLISILCSGILIIYLCIGFIPNWGAVDKIAPQWLAMTCINLLAVSFFNFNRKYFSSHIHKIISSSLALLYLGFILWAGLSYFYAINPTEVIVNITRQINVLLMFTNMGILFFSIRNKLIFFPLLVSSILIIEVYYVLVEAIEMIRSYGVISSGSLKGVTANRNITAFSLSIKIPFLLFLIYKTKKRVFKILFSIVIFLCLVALSMIQSRASFIAIGLVTIFFFVLNIYLYLKENKKKEHLLRPLYFIIPIILALFINQIFLSDKGADALSRAATISLNTNDGSVNQRLRYYEDVMTHMNSNLIFGVGLGNWKIKSIDYDSKDIVGYVVPYHAHSDFIQLGAELGIIGFLLYLSIFILAIYYVYVLLRFSDISIEEKVFLILLITSLGVYSIDANLNFPIARPQVLVIWTSIMAFITFYYQKNKTAHIEFKRTRSIAKIFLLISIMLIIPSLYITNQVYKSLKGQMFLLQDFNSNQFNVPLEQLSYLVPDIPNITVTTIPIKSIKARYFFNSKEYDKALQLLDEGTEANPYLFYSEILKSQIYQEKGQLDSAKVYARKAFFGLPNNELHSSKYLNLINTTRDREALEEAFEMLTINQNLNNWKNYLIIASGLYPPGDEGLMKKAKKAVEIFSRNQEFDLLYRKIALGPTGVNSAIQFSNRGLKYFDEKDYTNAAIEFEKALTANPLEYSYFENAATANYLIGDLEKALNQINKVIDDLNPLNGKCEYIKAIIFIRMQDPIGACPLLEIALKSGYIQAEDALNQYCSQ